MAFPDSLSFAPVSVKARHDGWTPKLQQRFIVALAQGHSIEAAARLVGKSRTTAYALRRRSGAASFAAAWDAALAHAKRTRIMHAASAGPAMPPPAHDRRSAEALLDRLYPGWRSTATVEGNKADEAEPA